MGILNRERLSELLSVRSEYCLSMYFVTPGAEAGNRQDRIRFRELLLRAEDQLVAAALERSEARKFLQSAEELRSDEEFWARCSEGVALFLALDWFRVFQLPQRFRDLVVVGSRFCVRPLLPLLQDDGRFYVLALTADDAHLYEATRHSIREVWLPAFERADSGDGDGPPLPQNVLADPRSPSPALEDQQTETSESRSRAALIHFFRQVEEVVHAVLDDLNAPLVLASMGYLASLYESVNSYPQLLREKVPGSPSIWSMHELREQAWQMVESRFRKRREGATAAYCALLGTELASDDVREIVRAAGEGRIASLFIEPDRGLELGGESRRSPTAVCEQLSAEADDLLDHTALQTLSHGGSVFDLCDIPTDSRLAAIFRY